MLFGTIIIPKQVQQSKNKDIQNILDVFHKFHLKDFYFGIIANEEAISVHSKRLFSRLRMELTRSDRGYRPKNKNLFAKFLNDGSLVVKKADSVNKETYAKALKAKIRLNQERLAQAKEKLSYFKKRWVKKGLFTVGLRVIDTLILKPPRLFISAELKAFSDYAPFIAHTQKIRDRRLRHRAKKHFKIVEDRFEQRIESYTGKLREIEP